MGCRKLNRKRGGSALQLATIVNVVATEIGAETLGLRRTWNHHRDDAAQGSDEQSVYGGDRFADDAVASQGSCGLNPAAIMQNPDSLVRIFSALARGANQPDARAAQPSGSGASTSDASANATSQTSDDNANTKGKKNQKKKK